MNWLEKNWLKLVLVALPLAASVWFWNEIPDTVPIHWNAAGEPDGYGSKWVGLLLWPILMVFIYGLFAIIPLIDPKKKTDQFKQTINKLADIVALFFLVMFFLTLFNYLGYEIQMGRWVLIGVTLLFLLLGNYFGKLKPNYFIGIRTPWTLENEENWQKTHRLSGMIWVVGSLIMLSFLIFNYQPWVVILFVVYAVTLAAIPIGYSFWLYKQEE